DGMSTAATTAATPATVQAGGPGGLLANIATVTRRNLHRLVPGPTLGALATPGVHHYIDYLLPGIYVLAIAFGASQTGVAIADDLATGMIDRFRALPMTRSAVLAGRTLADAVRNVFVLLLMTGVGYAIGFRFHAGTVAAWGAVAL